MDGGTINGNIIMNGYQPIDSGQGSAIAAPLVRGAINLEAKDIVRISTGLQLVDALSWRGASLSSGSILNSDRETKDILIRENDLMRIIQLVTPGQKERTIRLIKE